ncbi:Exopolyphosphatase [Rhodovastum atsumiense]|uniref:Ppx/GppA family phosphatase n=1 Tax=Rhodovastum atsumiense TaxID=504468 RepID=A0A5M6IY15_9PROT|nr:Ppx/GppA family phosphatase [Rhodovastum atsumiense]KAA5612268.1 Ppx/GppA family phosphatase [Rhodovastum atsumiense]CAH2601593.1 Exopolyphosphatase [Rhodovastum atsumiense]
MPYMPPAELPRCAVVDLGSNSVRLVVFEGRGRNPMPIFNEKAVLRLGRGLQGTGRLNDEAVAQALTVMGRYAAIARAMGANPFEVLATAAVRDAANGPDFVAALAGQMPGVPIRILAGEEEAALSAQGLLCGIPHADGVLADIGGGSLEFVRLEQGRPGIGQTLKLGVIRLAERAGGDPMQARAIAEQDLLGVPWLGEMSGRDLFLVGGAWRALARIHLAQTAYPLNMVHHYTIGRDEARDLAGMIISASRRTLERMPGVPRRRIDDLPFAAVVLRRVLRSTGVRRVVFSAAGLREGWYMRQIEPPKRDEDPLLAAGIDFARRFGRDPALPPALVTWTDPLFPGEPAEHRRLREASCWLSDVGSHEHPEYRAEQTFLHVLRQPGVGMDHQERAFLGLALALRYEAEPDAGFLQTARQLLSPEAVRRATILGMALRLAYTLSAGTLDLLRATRLEVGGALTLRLAQGSGVFAGESVTRRLDRLGQAMGLATTTEAG